VPPYRPTFKTFRAAKGRGLNKHFSQGYQRCPGHAGGMIEDQQIHETHLKNKQTLSSHRFLGLLERYVNTLLHCSQNSVLSPTAAEWT